MNLLDYYFRHDRGSFWLLKHIIGDNKLCRLINPFVNHASDKNIVTQPIMKGILNVKNIVIQDIVVPLSKMQSVLDFVNDKYSIYPIWLCVCRNKFANKKEQKESYLGIMNMPSVEDFYIDIGIYGCSSKVRDKNKSLTELEKFTYSNEGFMCQYAVTTLTRTQFDSTIIKKEFYTYLRKKYYAEDHFPDIYDKLGTKN